MVKNFRMNMIKKILIGFCFFCFFTQKISAQSSMSDEQVIQYVMSETEKGTSQGEIAASLLKKGVSMEQLQKLRSKYGSKGGDASFFGSSKNNRYKELETRLRKGQDSQAAMSKTGKSNVKANNGGTIAPMSSVTSDSLAFDYWNYLLEEQNGSSRIFGHNLFRNKKLTFEPEMNIATPDDYVLGPGDLVIVDVWGASQKVFNSEVSPDGNIDLEDYGPVYVSGMTVAEANRKLKNTLGLRYQQSHVKLTVGQTKTITVNVMGEVTNPGTYTLSSFSSVFHALYMAGGPNDLGTLRDVKIFRNNREIASVDIYDYIVNGNLKGNISLRTNDVILVGPYKNLVTIAGKVKRPMVYEMKDKESIEALLKFSGGFTGDAYQKMIRVMRKSGDAYSVYNVDEFKRGVFQLKDCDSLFVDSVLDKFSNLVQIQGAVKRPGDYNVASINTITQLIEAAGGLEDDAITTRAVLHRRLKNGQTKILSISLDKILSKEESDVILQNEDVLYVPGTADWNSKRYVMINGEVMYPGNYQFSENMSIEDLIIQAGGLSDAASFAKIDVSRRIRDRRALKSGQKTSINFSFSIKDGFILDGDTAFVLEPYDEVFVRKSPGFVIQQHVTIEGEVAFEGQYAIDKSTYRLSDLVNSAGGLSIDAYSKGAYLERKLTESERLKLLSKMKLVSGQENISEDMEKQLPETKTIGIDLQMALQHPGNDVWDICLSDGDRLYIPKIDNTVSIGGAVMYPNTVSYKKGSGLDYYINQVGGFKDNAKKRKVFVVNMNGTVSRVKRASDIQPGAQIVVPEKEKKNKFSFGEIMSLGTTLTALITVIATLVK